MAAPARQILDSDITMSPMYGATANSSSSSDSSFDGNMVIILAALLCALVFALGLNSIVRCALQCPRTPTYDDDASRRLAVKMEALKQIPVVVYQAGGVCCMPATDCPICLGEFVEGDDVRVLPACKHGFHATCIDKWLVLHSSCPNCRRSFNEHPVEEVTIRISS